MIVDQSSTKVALMVELSSSQHNDCISYSNLIGFTAVFEGLNKFTFKLNFI